MGKCKNDAYRTESNGSKTSKVDMFNWKILDKPGEFMWIDKGELSVNHEYQREKISVWRVNEFAANWSWVKCGVLIVVIRNDEWFVVDGQHRKIGADKRSDIKKLPCMVYELETVAKEALAFVAINTSKSVVGSFDKFRALLVGKDETAIGMNDMLKATGHYYANSGGTKGVGCIMTIWGLYKRDKKLVKELWPLIADVNQGCAVTMEVVKSIYGAERQARIVKQTLLTSPIRPFLIKCGGEYIGAELKKEVNITGMGGSRIIVNALIKLINKQRSLLKIKLPLVE